MRTKAAILLGRLVYPGQYHRAVETDAASGVSKIRVGGCQTGLAVIACYEAIMAMAIGRSGRMPFSCATS